MQRPVSALDVRPLRPGATIERVTLALGALTLVAWPIALSEFQRSDIYVVMGPFALVVIALFTFLGAKLHKTKVDTAHIARNAGIGLACGVAMTLLTYVAYALAARLFPSLASHVSGLYASSRTESLGPALAWTLVILCAEEVLWRGPLLSLLDEKVGRRAALAISLVTYVAAQSASGSPIVALAALVCGAIWLAERSLTGSVITPLVSHAIWTSVVIHLIPVTAAP